MSGLRHCGKWAGLEDNQERDPESSCSNRLLLVLSRRNWIYIWPNSNLSPSPHLFLSLKGIYALVILRKLSVPIVIPIPILCFRVRLRLAHSKHSHSWHPSSPHRISTLLVTWKRGLPALLCRYWNIDLPKSAEPSNLHHCCITAR